MLFKDMAYIVHLDSLGDNPIPHQKLMETPRGIHVDFICGVGKAFKNISRFIKTHLGPLLCHICTKK